ncbi:uncharacterized protein K02A2.6-like [Leguminivora glycinivorella]|uniref:uncharacterized protein K02A2.6-like n=1 Tax=Leguminivora glycinivorella TaxID=1035111 RepID=UPI00200D2967|nr:uncharacterized protein K02A2.6-like [Leguminivora glycinivorella]
MVIRYIKEGWPECKQDVDDQVKPYWGYRDELTVAHGMAWKGDRIIIPASMRKEMLRRVHIGHLGLEKCKLKVRESVFWPNINSQLEDLIKNCQACLTFKNQNGKESLIPHEIPDRAWSKIGVDVFHYKEKKYLLVVDYFSKFLEVIELNCLLSSHIIEQLKIVFSHQGIPNIVISDNGPEFSSSQFKQFSQQWCFEHITSSPCYSQSNGQVERNVQTVKNILKKTSVEKTDFRQALLEYLTTPITNQLASPSELLNNRKFRGIVPYAPKLLHPKIQVNVTAELEKRQIKQKLQYDKTAHDLKQLLPGQKVKVRVDKKWVSGTILQIKGIRSYLIQLMQGGTLVRNRRHLIVDSEFRPELPVCPRPYDDITVTSDNDNARAHAPARQPQSHAQRAVINTAPVSDNAPNSNNNYVTRSGRVVIPPDWF